MDLSSEPKLPLTASRRSTLRLLGIGGAAALLGGQTRVARAEQPEPKPATPEIQQGGGFYRFRLGELTVAVVSDGGFVSRPSDIFPKVSDSDLQEVTDRAFLSPGHLPTQINTLFIQTPSAKILVDTGAAGAFGPTTGQLLQNLGRVGVTPNDITHVIITHVHPDHAGGLLTADGKSQFAKAKIYVNQAEHDFWMSDAPKFPDTLLPDQVQQGMIAGAKKALAGVKAQLELTKPDAVIADVVTVVDAAGHTPGHVALRIKSGEDSLLYISDTIVAAPIQMPHPDWQCLYDADSGKAIETRKRLLGDAATGRTLIAGSHLAFPSLGHVGAARDAFRWVPRLWEW